MIKNVLNRAVRDTFTLPILLALITAAGLLSALLGDDVWDKLSWGALGLPVIVCIWYGLDRRQA